MILKEHLKKVLVEQKRKIEDTHKEKLVLREKLKEIQKFVKIKSNIIITGVRRCGKSVFLAQIINKFCKNYYYINFEDERLATFTLDDFDKLYEVLIELFGKNKTFFLDEIQNVEGWERWVRRMYDNSFKFFITGSNASLLSRELGTKLTGRQLQFSIFPFSFKEFLTLKKFELKKQDIYITEKKAMISKYLSEYLDKGGFPEYLKDEKIEILQEYFNDILERDIITRYNIKNIKQLKELAGYLITNTANLTTNNKLKNFCKIKSTSTIIKYIHYLENAYLLFSVPIFSYSLKNQVANPFKVYAIDVGLRNAISFKFSKDLGRIYENVIALELKRNKNLFYYWKSSQSNYEVDFVIKKGIKINQLIQVCYNLDDLDTKKREIRALIKASKELKCKNLLVITEDYEKEEEHEWFGTKRKIKFIPLWKWLLKK